MGTVPRLILLQGGRRSNGDKENDAKPVADRDVIYRADYTQLWR
jgi:hypothetical protein